MAITEGRDAVQGLRASTVQTNDLARAMNTLGEELALTLATRAVQHFASRLKATRETCIRFCVTKSTGLPLRRFGTHFTMLRLGRSRWKSGMTINNSGCACGMTVKALIKRFCRGMGVRDTLACPACGNAPIP